MMTNHKKQSEDDEALEEALEDIIEELGLTDAQIHGAMQVFEELEKLYGDQTISEITDAQLLALKKKLMT
jgi:hypothetical protein